jgi:hypothetical protein
MQNLKEIKGKSNSISKQNKKSPKQNQKSSTFGNEFFKKNQNNILDNNKNSNFFILNNVICKMKIIYWMIISNISNNTFSSLEKLISIIGKNDEIKLFGHSSSYSFYEFSRTFYDSYKIFLKTQFQENDIYSLLIDESDDVSKKNQLSVYIKYIDKNINPVISFLSMKSLENNKATGKNLLKLVLDILNEWNLDPLKMISLCTDGGKNFCGSKKGMSKLLLKKTIFHIHVHCFAHRLQLVMSKTLKNDSLLMLKESKNDINLISVYVNSSSMRKQNLYYIQKNINKKPQSISQLVETRWSSFYFTVYSIINNIKSIQILLSKEAKNGNKSYSKYLLDIINKKNFKIILTIFYIVLGKVNITVKQLQQQEKLNVANSMEYLNQLKQKLQDLKSGSELKSKMKKYLKNDNNLINNNEKINPKKLLNSYINLLDEEMNKRFKEDIITKLINIFDPKYLINLNKKEWKLLRIKYCDVLKNFKKLFSEKRYAERIKDFNLYKKNIKNKLKTINSLTDVCMYILNNSTFADAVTLVRLCEIVLLIPPTTVPVEAGFNIMNIKKNKYSNRYKQSILNFLMLIKINNKYINENLKHIIETAAKKWIVNKKRRGLKKVLEYSTNSYSKNLRNKNIKNFNEYNDEINKTINDYSALSLVIEKEIIPKNSFSKKKRNFDLPDGKDSEFNFKMKRKRSTSISFNFESFLNNKTNPIIRKKKTIA